MCKMPQKKGYDRPCSCCRLVQVLSREEVLGQDGLLKQLAGRLLNKILEAEYGRTSRLLERPKYRRKQRKQPQRIQRENDTD
jgi:hypothetical protein